MCSNNILCIHSLMHVRTAYFIIIPFVTIIIIIIIHNTRWKTDRRVHSIQKLSVTVTEDWKADGYRWYQNGRKSLPSSAPVEGNSAPVKARSLV